MIRPGGEIKVVNYVKITRKIKEYVSELKLNKVLEVGGGRLLGVEIARMRA